MENLFLKRPFEKLDLTNTEVILVISSLHNAFNDVPLDQIVLKIRQIYESLKNITSKDRLLVFPAFTYSFTTTGIFDLNLSHPERMGALSKMAFKEKSFFRTPSPMTSFLIWPPEPKIKINTFSTTFGNTSFFGWLKKQKCRIILIGKIPDNELGWIAAHYCEEISNVPYRYFKTFRGKIITGFPNSLKHTQLHYARRLSMNVKNDYTILNQKLRERNMRTDFETANISVSSVWYHDIIKISKEILEDNPYGLTNLRENSDL